MRALPRTPSASDASARERDYRLAWLSQLVFFVGYYALIVPLPRYLSGLGLADWQVGLIAGATAVTSLALRPASGPLTDAIGAKQVMLAGAAALAFGAIGFTLTGSAPVLFALRMLQAAGYVAFTTAGNALVSRLSTPADRAKRVAYFGMAANFAMTLVPGAVDTLLPVIGLLGAFWLSGVASGAAAAVSLPIGAAQPAGQGAPAALRLGLGLWKFPRVLWLSMVCAALFGAGFGAYFQFFSLLAERRAIQPAGLLFVTYGLAIIATRLTMARRLDQLGFARVMTASAAIMAAGLALAAVSATLVPMMIAAALIASSGGLFHPMLIAHHVTLLPGASGRAVACFYFGFDAGIGVGAWVLGTVLDAGGFTPMYLVAALFVLATLPLVPRLARD